MPRKKKAQGGRFNSSLPQWPGRIESVHGVNNLEHMKGRARKAGWETWAGGGKAGGHAQI